MPNLLSPGVPLFFILLQCFCVEPAYSKSSGHRWLDRLWPRGLLSSQPLAVRSTEVIWLPQDEYSGTTFFDRFDIKSFPDGDPTHGMVNYLNRSEAQQKNLFYVQDDGIVIMKADNTTTLQAGQFRDSIRIQSQAEYTTGLFILDLNHAPWGCAIWPAFWTTGASWPANGEVDIIEGVHDNEHNQVAWHTLPGCTLNPQTSFSGNISSNHTDCDATIDDNAGCSITEWSRASYGPFFDSQGGGVFAMKWDNDSIGVWSFYRAAVPQDIVSGSPDPDNWGVPSAMLDSSQCNISQYFANHNIIFDITFCGDWAGNSYATSGCPGTCEERLMDPSNFDNASWSINSLKVYKRQVLNGQIESSAITNAHMSLLFWILIYAAVGEAILRLL